MINQAIEKIEAEMEENKNPYTEIIGNYVIQQIQVNPQVAEAIINEEKTLAGSLEQMRNEALKENIKNNEIPEHKEEVKKINDDFNISLDDFI